MRSGKPSVPWPRPSTALGGLFELSGEPSASNCRNTQATAPLRRPPQADSHPASKSSSRTDRAISVSYVSTRCWGPGQCQSIVHPATQATGAPKSARRTSVGPGAEGPEVTLGPEGHRQVLRGRRRAVDRLLDAALRQDVGLHAADVRGDADWDLHVHLVAIEHVRHRDVDETTFYEGALGARGTGDEPKRRAPVARTAAKRDLRLQMRLRMQFLPVG